MNDELKKDFVRTLVPHKFYHTKKPLFKWKSFAKTAQKENKLIFTR